MRVVIFGATGMVGRGALLECLEDRRVGSVLVVGRQRVGLTHPKLTELLHQDFFDYTAIDGQFASADACFFCLGVSSAGMREATYSHLTYDLTLAAARALAGATPGRLTFCYVSGEGTDSSETGRVMWARVKGKTENALLRMPFKGAYMLRPAYIQPLKGVRSSTRFTQLFYTLLGPLYPLWRLLIPQYVTTTANVGKALIEVTAEGSETKVLRTRDINRLAVRRRGA
jgi:uncharacterized protein YbjT (DUF2867 family)